MLHKQTTTMELSSKHSYWWGNYASENFANLKRSSLRQMANKSQKEIVVFCWLHHILKEEGSTLIVVDNIKNLCQHQYSYNIFNWILGYISCGAKMIVLQFVFTSPSKTLLHLVEKGLFSQMELTSLEQREVSKRKLY